jgi:hypothetical protein
MKAQRSFESLSKILLQYLHISLTALIPVGTHTGKNKERISRVPQVEREIIKLTICIKLKNYLLRACCGGKEFTELF